MVEISDAAPPTMAAGQADSREAAMRMRNAVAVWLFVCCALVLALVVVGGVTRLTHSGLSITEWAPIVGTLPPLTDADWAGAFARYRPRRNTGWSMRG